ncbi:MAG: cell division protein SepF [Nanoarchaeota archaeon]|nr:cell division protein SepF [Nanoarchaeota archaeon]
MGIFSKIKDKLKKEDYFSDDIDSDYVEIDTEVDKSKKAKITIRPFVIEDFADIKSALDALREGMTIALLNIKPLKDKDIVELKRAINKVKKTCDAIGGDIAGFGEDWIVVTPSFAQVYRSTQTEDIEED